MVFAIFFSFCLILLVVCMVNHCLAKAYRFYFEQTERERRKTRRTVLRPQKSSDVSATVSGYRNALEMRRLHLALLFGNDYHESNKLEV